MITIYSITMGIFILAVIIIGIALIHEQKDKRFEDEVLKDIKKYDKENK